ncbi:MAG: DUF5131 family protein [Pirellulales bacterium]
MRLVRERIERGESQVSGGRHLAENGGTDWTDTTWNPVTGCSKVSPGCKHCCAERLAERLQAMGVARYRDGFAVRKHEDLLDLPSQWRQPRLILVASMGDLFHEDVPEGFIRRVFETMKKCRRHTFQVLTKRSERLVQLAESMPWPANVWMGVSIENAEMVHRVKDLQEVPAAVRFVACEPLLGPIEKLPLEGIHWVLVGGESGPKARPMQAAWVEMILQQTRKAKVPFHFKQWGCVRKNQAGRKLRGRIYDEMPAPHHGLGRPKFLTLLEQTGQAAGVRPKSPA